MGIFKAYDIRGLCPQELDESKALNIGRAFGVWLERTVMAKATGPVAIGWDMRGTSPGLAQQLTRGLTETGHDVVRVGLCSTPMLNYSVARRGYRAGVMITASHNPSQYNGFKLCRQEGIPLSADTGIKDLERWVDEESSRFEPSPRLGTVTDQGIFDDYVGFHTERINPGSRSLKIIADSGNGMTGAYEFKILKQLFPDTTGMFLDLDGNFPNHEANPLVDKNLVDLRKEVLARKADVGIAFDGDGDRAAFLDELGQAVQGDLVLALLAKSLLEKHPGKAVLYDLRSSWAVKEEIEKAGGKPVLSRVGHAFIKKTLREHDGILGGELSGHFYFRDFYFLDSGILAALTMLEFLSHQTTPLSELIAPLDRYPRTGEINFVVENADRVIKDVETKFSADGGKSLHLDGLSIEMSDWWFNLRKSNTEPILRLNLQAKTRALLDEKYALVRGLIGGHEHD